MAQATQDDIKLAILRFVRDQNESLTSDRLRNQIDAMFKTEEGVRLGDMVGEAKESLRDDACLLTYDRGRHCLTVKGCAVLAKIEALLAGNET